ncbi:MAG TPA: chloride channel protein [Thermomicrobiales bacterium]|nr:chloride channel protein [Thermomicrobiales bacterium]
MTASQDGTQSTLRRFVGRLMSDEPREELGDFETTARVLPISLLAVGIGILSAFVALALLRLINLFTYLFFYQKLDHWWDTALVSPAPARATLGPAIILVPIIGSFIIGLMARYGSERIRGHGIPEALEAILINGSRIEPRVAILKPLSSAISIGSGGPFGAEGPIIMTGGAFGSMIAQFFRLTSAERKTLLVAGAAGGMAATFASPVAAILIAAELLLFELKPRSLVPVALASVAATIVRRYILGPGPLFPLAQPTPVIIGLGVVGGCIVVGILAGALSTLLTSMVYAAEDAFTKLPIHWMWWPMLGGLVVGIGGFIQPKALGVGYDIIREMVQGGMAIKFLFGILIVKSIIWSVSLGSGTSGGVLAPLLMMGGALGGLMATFLPHQVPGFWALVGMGAILGGTMRSPFTGIVFAVELTHDVNMLLPLTIAAFISHLFTVLVLKRSILTEKVARRGYHLSREYAVDPLEILFVREVMRTNIVALPESATPAELALSFRANHGGHGQYLYPVVGPDRRLKGVVTRADLQGLLEDRGGVSPDGHSRQLADLIKPEAVVAYTDEPLRKVVYRMAETGLTRFPVLDRKDGDRLSGMVALNDLLRAREHNLQEERRREQVLKVRLLRRAAPARVEPVTNDE